MQEFIEFTNFYKKFIRGYSSISALITDLTKKDKSFNWTENQQFAFDKFKRRFSKTLILTIFDPKKSIILKIDVSDYAIGACII
jgi:RNase H-like domain found in reverse transcriptase